MMALFQPFKPTKRMPGSNLVQATFRQGMLDQQAKRDENAIRSANQKGIVGLGSGINTLAGNPIGEYLREMMGTTKLGESEDLPSDPNRIRGDSLDPRGGQINYDETNIVPSESMERTDPNIISPDQLDLRPPSTSQGATQASVTPNPGSGMFGTPPPPDFGMEHANASLGPASGGEMSSTDPESIKGILENLFSGGGDAAVEAGTDAALEQGGEQVAEAAAEEAGGSMVPGMGSIMSLAEGDVKGAAAKMALTSMLPPPYGQILAMLI
jgi:hypothetical protein